MNRHVMDTAATMVTTHPDTILSSRRPLNPLRPSHRPTPVMAPTVAGVDLQQKTAQEKGTHQLPYPHIQQYRIGKTGCDVCKRGVYETRLIAGWSIDLVSNGRQCAVGTYDMGIPKREARMMTAATHSSTQKPARNTQQRSAVFATNITTRQGLATGLRVPPVS